MCEKKICTKCREEKSLDEFGKSKRTKDEKQPRCKKCLNEIGKIANAKRKPTLKPENAFKICSSCLIEKHVDEFYLNPRLKLGVHSECINCTKNKVCKWAKDNPDKMAINGKKYRDNHKTEEQLRARKYQQSNREERRKYNLTWK